MADQSFPALGEIEEERPDGSRRLMVMEGSSWEAIKHYFVAALILLVSGSEGGNNNDHTSINIDPNTEPVDQVPEASMLLPRALWTMALLTLIFDIGTLLYKPATGVVFGHSTLAYYLTLSGIFTAGVIEAITAFWISRSPDVYKRRFSFGRVVLCASVGPFVVILGIGGSAFIRA